MAKRSANIDFAELQRQLSAQFRDLDRRDPSRWPIVPRSLLYIVVAAFVVTGVWFLWLNQFEAELETERTKETQLRTDYQAKLTKAVNLVALKKQREQVQQYVLQLEKQLPSKAEMAALLSDVNQAGLGRSLQFDLFRPGTVVARDYYAELPIAIRVTGRYHDIGSFASDVANLSRIVTLNNLTIAPAKDGNLTMDATARTFRYLDAEEVAAQRAAAAAAKAKK